VALGNRTLSGIAAVFDHAAVAVINARTRPDREVLDAYGWRDISTDCEFLLDYEVEDDDEPGKRRKKKPWRYRWPDEVHDEVLARLLDLNQRRAAEEKLVGTKPRKPRPKPRQRKPAAKPGTPANIAGLPLFDRSKS
jgi:hypothetical protein